MTGQLPSIPRQTPIQTSLIYSQTPKEQEMTLLEMQEKIISQRLEQIKIRIDELKELKR
jgi:hypothetical protein